MSHLPSSSLYEGPIIDSHIHLFDPRRPQGIPWPEPGDQIYAAYLPSDFKPLAAAHRVAGAVVVEASPWVDDNYWMLETVRNEPVILGFVGNLSPLSEGFEGHIERLSQEKKFLGLRYGNLWDRDLLDVVGKPAFLDGAKLLADAGRSLDSANPDIDLLKGLCRLVESVPGLRVIIDHLPNATVHSKDRAEFDHLLSTLATANSVMIKLSEIPQAGPAGTVLDPGFYRERINQLWDLFGEDRCLFGSDWPNSEHLASYSETVGLLSACLAVKSLEAQRKCFFENAAKAYPLIFTDA